MKTVAFVPMKLNNRRLPQKNTKPFTNGKPLCWYILKTLLANDRIDDVYVYCSNPDIQEFIPDGVKYLPRSTSLDQDTTKINEVLQAFAQEVPAQVYVLAHATAPFMSNASICSGLDAVCSGKYDSALAVKKIQSFLWQDGAPFNYNLDCIPRTQDLDPIYEETCGLYIYKRDLILERNRRNGDKPFLVEVSQIEATDIDEAENFAVADAIINHFFRSDAGMNESP